MKNNKYYSIHRPVSIGTYPADGMVEFKNYDARTRIPSIGRDAWGELYYDRKLTEEELAGYELVPEKEPEVTFFVASCMEFYDMMGTTEYGLHTIEEAISVYEDFCRKEEDMAGYSCPGIGATVSGSDYSLFEGGMTADPEWLFDMKDNPSILGALEVLREYEGKKNIKDLEGQGMVFPHKEEYSTGYRLRLTRDIYAFLTEGYDREQAFLLAQTKGRHVDVSGIRPSMQTEDIRSRLQEKKKSLTAEQLEGMDFYILDTETTGLSGDDEVIEIGITDKDGNTVYEQMFRPEKSVGKASAVNGITDEMLADKPGFAEKAEEVAGLLMERPVLIYNAAFDSRMILQTMALHADGIPEYDTLRKQLEEHFRTACFCMMQTYADITGSYKCQSLALALKENGIDRVQSHRAVDDCTDVAVLVRTILAKGGAAYADNTCR